jgi:hypothetical protein
MAKDKSIKGGKRLPIQYHVPDHIQSQYATNLLVQNTEHEFILSFFELQEPFLIGDTPEEIEQQLEQLRSVRATCVGRVIIAADRMPAFIDAMQKNLEKYRARLDETEEG